MNQALSEKKESSGTNKEKQYASILASVNRNQSSINTNSTQQLIQKHKLSVSTSPAKIGEILALELINKQLLKLIKKGEK